MPEYDTYCPISLTTDVLADRWTPLVIRELIMGNTRFNDIHRGLPAMSRSLLVQRLRHLERKGVVEAWPLATGRGFEYRLSPAGKDLQPIIVAMGRWAVNWLYDELDDHDVEAQTLMWWMHRRVDVGRFPPGRTVVQFDHTAPAKESYWLVLEHDEASICLQHPRLETDVSCTMATPTLASIFAGSRSWRDALTTGDLAIEGAPKLVKALPTWFTLSSFSEDVRQAAASTTGS